MSKKKKQLRLAVKDFIPSKIDRKLLVVTPFSMDIEVLGVDSDDPKAEKASEKIIATYKSRYTKEFESLQKSLKNLQAEESAGQNAEAFDQAKALLKTINDKLGQDVDDIRSDIRDAILKATKTKTQTIGRTTFKEMKLAKGAFAGDVGDAKYASNFSKSAKSLLVMGGKLIKAFTNAKSDHVALLQSIGEAKKQGKDFNEAVDELRQSFEEIDKSSEPIKKELKNVGKTLDDFKKFIHHKDQAKVANLDKIKVTCGEIQKQKEDLDKALALRMTTTSDSLQKLKSPSEDAWPKLCDNIERAVAEWPKVKNALTNYSKYSTALVALSKKA